MRTYLILRQLFLVLNVFSQSKSEGVFRGRQPHTSSKTDDCISIHSIFNLCPIRRGRYTLGQYHRWWIMGHRYLLFL